jgi:hypothetical protein
MPKIFEGFTPLDPRDSYPITDVEYQKGGWRQVETLVDRDAISLERRTRGMVVFISSLKESWTLLGSDLSNSSWQKLSSNIIVEQFSNPVNGIVSINHNFGYAPTVTIYDADGVEGFAEIRHPSLNTITILFNKSNGLNVYPTGTIILK